MRLNSMLSLVVLLAATYPAVGQEPAAKPVPVKIGIDLNSQDLETELRKAELQLRLRELELNAADGRQMIEANKQALNSLEAKLGAVENAVAAAEKSYDLAQSVAQKGLMSQQELMEAKAKLEKEKAKLQEVVISKRAKEVELDSVLREVDLTRERAMIAVELAQTEMEAVQKRMIEMQAIEKRRKDNGAYEKLRLLEKQLTEANLPIDQSAVKNAIELELAAIGEQLQEIRKRLAIITEKSKAVAKKLSETSDDGLKSQLEDVVAERFQLEQMERALRVKMAQAKLEAVEQRRKARESNAAAIKARMMQELLGK